ncbi:hypothetical protein H5398_00430 [Tessaracoccus sp. MC1679]|uniref:hypothetical protein n=1 Tax=Tessaracoccus sp. MC1679 TaxID=2760313 RepID=UPI001600C609|nr:hypothetical protein [Tessaracoccus sp. MC1679]MBB1514451.1 hypothetical protein [Tessaracoccus sp. MC1679]
MTIDRLLVDCASPVGSFRGGASGTLYGLGDDGVPTAALLNGAHLTNTSQKAPFGTQHPSGDALAVEGAFFAKHGRDMYIYIQDHYPDWPYHGGRRPGDGPDDAWAFLEVVERITEAVATRSARPRDYVLIPFNEPDGGNWYPEWPEHREQFLADWLTVVGVIRGVWARHGLGEPRIGGPGDMQWQPERTADFLDFAVVHGCLPEVFIWHELGIDNLGTYRGHLREYRAMEAERGIEPIDVNITEYGMLRDLAVPGQLIQWLAMFEDTKVDAQMAYWNYAGNLSDNTARAHGANGGWWMLKWYGDLEGSTTVAVTPPEPDAPDTLQAIAAVDAANARATVLFGGTDRKVLLEVSGLDPALFGGRVDVEVREAVLTGVDGLHAAPRLVSSGRGVPVADGGFSLTVAPYDRHCAYQALITAAAAGASAPDPWCATVEAEDTILTSAEVSRYDPKAAEGWQFLASGGADVSSFREVSSSAAWTVEVPRDGTYRFQAIGSAAGEAGRHALFVDGMFAAFVEYPASLALNERSRGKYRGSAETMVRLGAGRRELSLRTSIDGVSLLPGAEVTLDRLVLMDATDGDPATYPASTFRLFDGAQLEWPTGGAGGARLAGAGRADVYASAWKSGYHDLAVRMVDDGGCGVSLRVNGQDGGSVGVAAGAAAGVARVFLAQGINEIELSCPGGTALVRSLVVTRTADVDVVRVPWHGGATLPRDGALAAAGEFVVVVTYANAELRGSHDYNPQVVDRRLEVWEGASQAGDAHVRYTYSWDNFWERAIPVTLTTADQPLRLLNPTGEPPLIREVGVARLRHPTH